MPVSILLRLGLVCAALLTTSCFPQHATAQPRSHDAGKKPCCTATGSRAAAFYGTPVQPAWLSVELLRPLSVAQVAATFSARPSCGISAAAGQLSFEVAFSVALVFSRHLLLWANSFLFLRAEQNAGTGSRSTDGCASLASRDRLDSPLLCLRLQYGQSGGHQSS
ncbi:hypothetical protein ABW21_db0207883 [Orbilia brochopaga]|nr:hypothetical protein ABW21_db0207883 [Drechslerella brochopaga]